MAAGAVVTGGSTAQVLVASSTVAGLVSGYLNEDLAGATSAIGIGVGFEKYAASKGLPAGVASKLANSLSSMGVWDSIVNNAKGIFSDDE